MEKNIYLVYRESVDNKNGMDILAAFDNESKVKRFVAQWFYCDTKIPKDTKEFDEKVSVKSIGSNKKSYLLKNGKKSTIIFDCVSIPLNNMVNNNIHLENAHIATETTQKPLKNKKVSKDTSKDLLTEFSLFLKQFSSNVDSLIKKNKDLE